MVEAAVTGLTVNLLAAGITAGTGVAASTVRSQLRQGEISAELDAVATEFTKALREAITAENERRETNELGDVTDDWPAIAEELAVSEAARDGQPRRDADEVELLFTDEADAVNQIAEAYAAVEGIDLDAMPQASAALKDALTHAYRQAVVDFERRIAGTALADRLQTETGLVVAERVADLQERLTTLEDDVAQLLSQAARNEGFRQLSRALFARRDPSPEACWRVGFSLADVEAGLPAEREGLDADQASEELLDRLRAGENQLVVGRPGSGKSTLCKQVAVRWHEADGLGAVLYRETGVGGGFESTDDLARAITQADGPVLVVVEDAVRPAANSIAETIEAFAGDDSVRFLLDARRDELEAFETTGSLDVSAARRHAAVLTDIPQYPVPAVSETDVERVCAAFTDATNRPVRRDPATLYEAATPERDAGIGEMVFLAFLLPAADEAETAAGLESHVRARYETLAPDGTEAVRDLTAFDDELVADVGVMVTLLSASGMGIHQALVHALAHEYGHSVETHDTIESVLQALEGWFLFPTHSEGPGWTIHPLWATLYLRALAQDHAAHQASSRRRARSEPRVGTCLEALFRLFDEDEHREALLAEFPDSPVVHAIATEPRDQAAEYLDAIVEVGERWPVLAPLFGTTDTARYELPGVVSAGTYIRWVNGRGHMHRDHGAYAKARTEYEQVLDLSREHDHQPGVASSLDHLGLLARYQGAFEPARAYHEESLEVKRETDDQAGIATTLNNLGLLAEARGEYDAAREYHQDSLAIKRELEDRAGIARSLGNLGLVAQARGDFEAAREYHRESLAIERDRGNREGIASTLGNLGLVARQQGEYEAARTYHEDSLELNREMGDRAGVAASLNNLGLVAYEQRDLDDARTYLEDALERYRDLGNTPDIASSLGNLGLVAREQGDFDTAREYHEASLEIKRDLGDRSGIATSLTNLGLVAQQQGDAEAAREYYEDALERNRELSDRLGITICLANRGDLAHEQGEYEAAREFYEEATQRFQDLGAVRRELKMRRKLIKLDIDVGASDRAAERCDAATERLEALDRDLPDERQKLQVFSNAIPEA